jgi:hypothetical protein
VIVEVYKPEFTDFHEKPIVTWQESRGPIRVAVNMFAQYTSWLNHWTDPFRGKFAPGPAFWETSGPAICRALRYCDARALVFEWESDRKVAYRWFARTPESPTRFKNDYYSLCSVTATSRSSGESHVVVTLPTDEDVSFSFRSDSMKEWLQPKLPEEPKP